MNVISLVAFMFLSNLFFVQIAVLHDLNLLKIKTGNPVPLVKLHEDDYLAIWILLTLIQNTEMLRCVLPMLQKYM